MSDSTANQVATQLEIEKEQERLLKERLQGDLKPAQKNVKSHMIKKDRKFFDSGDYFTKNTEGAAEALPHPSLRLSSGQPPPPKPGGAAPSRETS
jgi:hypothetical protein